MSPTRKQKQIPNKIQRERVSEAIGMVEREYALTLFSFSLLLLMEVGVQVLTSDFIRAAIIDALTARLGRLSTVALTPAAAG
jgi:hypothetical protein